MNVTDNFQEGSFSAMARAIGKLNRMEEIVALKMLGKIKETDLLCDLRKKGQVGDRLIVL